MQTHHLTCMTNYDAFNNDSQNCHSDVALMDEYASLSLVSNEWETCIKTDIYFFKHLNSNSLFLLCFDDQIFNSTSCILFNNFPSFRHRSLIAWLLCFFFSLKILIICLVSVITNLFLKSMRTFACKMQMLMVNFCDRKAIWRGNVTCSEFWCDH